MKRPRSPDASPECCKCIKRTKIESHVKPSLPSPPAEATPPRPAPSPTTANPCARPTTPSGAISPPPSPLFDRYEYNPQLGEQVSAAFQSLDRLRRIWRTQKYGGHIAERFAPGCTPPEEREQFRLREEQAVRDAEVETEDESEQEQVVERSGTEARDGVVTDCLEAAMTKPEGNATTDYIWTDDPVARVESRSGLDSASPCQMLALPPTKESFENYKVRRRSVQHVGNLSTDHAALARSYDRVRRIARVRLRRPPSTTTMYALI